MAYQELKYSFQRKLDRQMGDLNVNNEKGQERGMHETWENRDACSVRYRNEGPVLPFSFSASHLAHLEAEPL